MEIDHIIAALNDAETESQYKKAFCRLLEEVLSSENADGMTSLAYAYGHSYAFPVDLERSIHWDAQAEHQLPKDNKGRYAVLCNMAVEYMRMGDIHAAIHFYEKAVEAGDLDSALTLAKLYNVTGRQTQRVKELLEKIYSEGYSGYTITEYSNELAEDYLEQLDKGMKKFKAKSASKVWVKKQYTNKMAEHKLKFPRDVIAKYANAVTELEFGNADEAKCLLIRMKREDAYPPASELLGRLYLYGIAGESNFNQSISHYQDAIRMGHTDALLGLAEVYRWGHEYHLYHDVLKEAVRHGYPKAQLLLAQLYDAVDVDKKQVKKLLNAVLENEKTTVDIEYEAQKLLKQVNLQVS